MPDLEQLIDQWRRSMAQGMRGREDVLDELEDHLRAELERLAERGYEPEQAFRVAVVRLGGPSEITSEFAKVPAAMRWLPVPLTWLAGALASAWLLGPMLPRLASGGVSALLTVHRSAVTMGYIATLAVGFLAVCFLLARLWQGTTPGQTRTLRRAALALSALAAALTGLGVVLGVWCPHEKAGPFWGLEAHEVGGLAVLAWDVVLLAACALCRRRARLGAVMLLGLVGNALVILGWLGAALGAHHPHTLPAGSATAAALLLLQVAVACTALAPAGCLRGRRA
jgi:hypothetical protein